MGKQKRKRQKPHKENPTGLPSVKDFEEMEDFTNKDRENALQSVLEQVQSVSIEEKLSGLQTLESMACDSRLAIYAANSNITKIVGPLLIDYNIPVRAAAACALRHIAENGGEEAYTRLLKDDIMTPLSGLLRKCYSDWQPKEKNKKDDEKETFIQTITLLWTLCENNECIIKYSNQDNLMSLLIKYLDTSVYDMEVITVSAQCMLLLSEDNPSAAEILSDYEETLISFINTEINSETNISEIIPLKTLSAGLLMNIINLVKNDSLVILNKVVHVLSETLTIDNRKLLRDLVLFIPPGKKDFPPSSKNKLQEFRKILGAQQQALEIFTNLCTDESESDNNFSLNDSDVEESESDYICDDPMNDNGSLKMISTLPVELVEIINSTNLIEKIWSKSIDIEENCRRILRQNTEGKAILKQIHTIRCRSYICMNNLTSSLEIDTLGGVDNLYKLWIEVGTIVFKNANLEDIELLEAATSVMRATLQKLAEARVNIFNQLTKEDVEPILNGERQCPNANVRANLIRILGNLALALMKDSDLQGKELVKHLSGFLLDSCNTESEGWVIAEALDAIMDIYAEDETDQLAAHIQLIQKLRTLLPLFKNKIHQQKKNLGDNALIVSTVNGNISRFIKYKEKRIITMK